MNWKFWTWGKRDEPASETESDADLDVGGWSADDIGAISRRRKKRR